MNRWKRVAIAVLLLVVGAGAVAGPARAEAEAVTAEQRREVVDGLAKLLDDLYVIPETADAMIARLQSDLAAGRFDSETDPRRFAATLTGILQGMSGDQHLRVTYGEEGEAPGAAPRIVRVGPGDDEAPQVVRVGPGGDDGEGPHVVRVAPGSGEAPRMLDTIEPFPRAELLPDNVACIEVRLFAALDRARDKAVEAMKVIADADAVLFDLRGCMGGDPEMVHFVTSYLYGPDPVHLLTYYHAHEPPDSAFTLAEVPGRRRPDIPVWIVTSSFTGSGGEEFTYVLEHNGRATVVGETTAGAGHGGGVHAVAAGFDAFIPDFRPVDPFTGGGWEGVGVKPDVEAPAAKALDVAHRLALREIAKNQPARAAALAPEIARLDAAIERKPRPVDTAALQQYAGVYGIRTIRVKDDGLYLQRVGGPELLLLPGDEPDTFTLKVLPTARIRFGRDGTGAVTELHVLNMQGEWEVTKRGE